MSEIQDNGCDNQIVLTPEQIAENERNEHPLLHIPIREDPNMPPNTIRIENLDGSHLFYGMTIPGTEAHEPAPRHDGTLDKRFDMRVCWLDMGKVICIHAGINDVFLGPQHALSLLDWLTQERETLEQLAKEQQ